MLKFEKLSRAEMKNVLAGTYKGPCSESCGSGQDITTCSSPTGDCSRDDVNHKITCDNKSYTCPGYKES